MNRPAQHKGQANKKGKNFRNTSRKLSKDVSTYRPDLKVAKASTLPASVLAGYASDKYGQTMKSGGKGEGHMHSTY